MNFKVTDAAAVQIRRAAQQGGAEGLALRLAARQMPDGSIEYLMGFDEPAGADIRVNAQGVEVVIAPEYLSLLSGAKMDYAEIAPGELRFIFLNPNDETYIPPQGEE